MKCIGEFHVNFQDLTAERWLINYVISSNVGVFFELLHNNSKLDHYLSDQNSFLI